MNFLLGSDAIADVKAVKEIVFRCPNNRYSVASLPYKSSHSDHDKRAVKNQHKGKTINPTEKDKNVVFFIVKNNILLAFPSGESGFYEQSE